MTEKSLRFWCWESKKVELKIHEEELQRYRGILVTISYLTGAFVIIQN